MQTRVFGAPDGLRPAVDYYKVLSGGRCTLYPDGLIVEYVQHTEAAARFRDPAR